MEQSEYAKAGVDPNLINPFKALLLKYAKQTIDFPLRHHCRVYADGSWNYIGNLRHRIAKPVLEGLGNKNWIAEWMYQFSGMAKSFYDQIAICLVMMAVNDLIVSGAMPATYNDEVAAGDSEWFTDMRRAEDFARGLLKACEMSGMALVGGESPSLKYLIKAEPPVTSAPSLSGCATGIIAPFDINYDASRIRAGDIILGVTSSGTHSNGYSHIIKKSLELPDKFLTKLPDGKTIGEEALISTRCYVGLVKAMHVAGIDVHAFQPGTGGGVGKVAFAPQKLTYHIHTWVDVPQLMRYFLEVIGTPLRDCLEMFNWGIGWYIFVARQDVDAALKAAKGAGYIALEVGVVKEGGRCTIFGPAKDLVLPPPQH